jgi:NAD(P)-dependent dehydrogenase (short-subunit alcohol dehydrogenase family)
MPGRATSAACTSSDGRSASRAQSSRPLASVSASRAIAVAFARQGADVAVNYRGNADAADAVAAEITGLGRKAIAMKIDTSKKADVDRMVGKTMETWGRVDVLVNNAGIDNIKPAIDYTETEWDEIVDINLKGYFLCAQAAGREMLRVKRGSIVMNSSMAGSIGIPWLVPYGSAKGGVNQLTRTLAVEWAREGVRVNAFSPGYFENVMQGAENIHNEEKERHIRSRTPMGRRGRAEELVGPVVFLASDASSYVTGHLLMVEGGWTAA